LFYKTAVKGLKIQATNPIFWILVFMIAIHHGAKEQFAWLNGVKMWAPYPPGQAAETRKTVGGED
jgi:hypothetical protein